MTDDGVDYAKRMHPDDRQALLDALRIGANALPPDRPPADLTGRDAAMFRQIVQEEIARDRAAYIVECRKLIHDEVERIFDEEVPEKFALIGLRIDNPDKIEETRKMIYELRQLQKATGDFKDAAWKEVLKAFGWWIGGVIAFILGFLGLKSGAGH